MPFWVTSARSEAFEDVAFLSGAALSHLHLVLQCEDVPHALLRDRLALRAAETCVAFSGRTERAGQLRDAVHFLRPGDLPGPAGDTYLAWRRAVARPMSIKALARALPESEATLIADLLDVGAGNPINRAAITVEAVLAGKPRAEVTALILANVVLGRSFGWDHLVPVVATNLTRGDLRKREGDLCIAFHRAVIASSIEATRLASDLTLRAGRLKAVAPKLRAKTSDQAVEMFLTQDAVASTALPLPDRSARRLCDRLVSLGAVRELTGRDTFRLFGL
jgi:hypothetical protein